MERRCAFKKYYLRKGNDNSMAKRLLSIFMALMIFVMPIAPALAGTTTDRNQTINDALSYLDGKIETLSVEKAKSLLDVIKSLDDKNAIVNTFFGSNSKLTSSMRDRLDRIGIDKDSVSAALGILRDNNFYNETRNYIEDREGKKDEYTNLISNVFDEIFRGNGPLTDFDAYVLDKFGTETDSPWRDYLKEIKSLELKAQAEVTFEYNKNTHTLTIKDTGDLLNKINSELLSKRNINELDSSDFDSLVSAINAVLAELEAAQVDAVKDALAALHYKVNIVPSDSGGSSGGGGGGGGTVPSEPEVEVPSSPEQPVSVNVPSDAVKVTVSDGKAVVTIDDKTVETLIKLLGDAEKKADGRPLAVVLDLASDKIGVNAEINLPAKLMAEAAGKGAIVTVNLKNVGIDVPASALGTGDVKLKVQAVAGSDAVKGIETAAGMKAVGNAVDIELSSGWKASSGEKAVLRFNIKGLAVNTDKLGAYFVDKENNKLIFVGGRVDRAANELRAIVPHFSTYVMMEYDRTFDDIKTHWARKYIESMAAKHVVDGRTPASFAPNDNLTRAEFTKLIVTAMELDLKPYKGTFEDVSKDAWYADYIQTAYENNLIQGRVEGKVFDPNGKITRQELMTIIGRALEEKADIAAIAGFKDAGDIAEYARNYVALLIEKGLVNGYPDNTVRPKANITRAEAVKVIYGLYNYE